MKLGAAWAVHLYKKRKVSVNIQRMYVRTYKLALELIVVQVEIDQIDEVAELLGQFSFKRKCQRTHNTCSWGIRLALKLVEARIEVHQVDKVAKLLGQFS